jgi:hypothetical protein
MKMSIAWKTAVSPLSSIFFHEHRNLMPIYSAHGSRSRTETPVDAHASVATGVGSGGQRGGVHKDLKSCI